ncbi:MAG: DCL family protein [Gammaproteobacteria bacterium]|nr:DCL family protein [Gammaproteobacteria bacterium]
MAGHPIELPSIQFKSKKDATEFFKKMLHSYADGDGINQLDDKYLFEVIQRHPEVKEKIGVGIKRFYREKSNSHPTSCFHLERYDGSTTDFSIPSCISSKEPTVEQGFYSACREAVSDKLISEKEKIFRNGNVKCFKTGEIVSINESEYRHTTPRFRDIVRDFISENEIKVTSSLLVESEDMQYSSELSDSSMKSEFKAFHANVANLEIFKKYER